jgi:putative membrane protein
METPDDKVPVGRTLAGGVLMGLANLVPGISGGTMILAIGLYDRFISAVADVSRLRLKRAPLVFLALLAVGVFGALVSLSGVAVAMVSDYRWVMYSLFIGMTLGGVPELARLSRPFSPSVVIGALVGIAIMVSLWIGMSDAQLPETMLVLVLVGALAASSMILPGVSGSYILLVLGMYDLVIGSLSAGALKEDLGGSLRVIVPVGIGAVLGVGLLSNVLKVVLTRYSSAAHGTLLGLLVGSVFALYPFQESLHADLADKQVRKATVMLLAGESGDAIRTKYGEEFDEARLAALATKWQGRAPSELKALGDELQTFTPKAAQVGSMLALLVGGFMITRLLGSKPKDV